MGSFKVVGKAELGYLEEQREGEGAQRLTLLFPVLKWIQHWLLRQWTRGVELKVR